MAKRPRKNMQALHYFATGELPPPKRAKPVQHELKHQQALWQWVRTQWWQPYFYHWGNERWSEREAHHLSGTGVKAGPWDNWLFLPRAGYVGAVLELKRAKSEGPSRLSKDQAIFGEQCLPDWAWYKGVAYGWDEAREFFEDYVAGNVPRVTMKENGDV